MAIYVSYIYSVYKYYVCYVFVSCVCACVDINTTKTKNCEISPRLGASKKSKDRMEGK